MDENRCASPKVRTEVWSKRPWHENCYYGTLRAIQINVAPTDLASAKPSLLECASRISRMGLPAILAADGPPSPPCAPGFVGNARRHHRWRKEKQVPTSASNSLSAT